MSSIKIFIEGLKEGKKYFENSLSALINSILLSIVYFIGIGITSIIGKSLGKSFLNNKTGWQSLNLGNNLNDYYRQF